MKEIATIHFNDLHIKVGNEDEVVKSCFHLAEYAKNNGVKEIICNGDVFDSRSHQRLSCLKAWERCLDRFLDYGITCHMNKGNHDKSRYDSEESFLDSFRHHPAMILYDTITDVTINGINYTFSPFFSDKILVPQLHEHPGGTVLIGHWECEGSTHLGKVSTKSSIGRKLLKKWDKTFLGHYHNYHEINENIIHLPSLRQNDFGEDDNKGFTVIYKDLSYEIISGVFRRFKKLSFDIDTITSKDIESLLKQHQNSPDSVRMEFSGSETKLKAIDKKVFQDAGIDLKLKFNKKYSIESLENLEIKFDKVYTEKDIQEIFKTFCIEKEYDYKIGKKLLDEFLKNEDIE